MLHQALPHPSSSNAGEVTAALLRASPGVMTVPRESLVVDSKHLRNQMGLSETC